MPSEDPVMKILAMFICGSWEDLAVMRQYNKGASIPKKIDIRNIEYSLRAKAPWLATPSARSS